MAMKKDPHNHDRSSRDKIFPQLLMEMLSEPSNSDSIAWLPNGKAFIISDPRNFAKHVLPKYFGKTKYHSFIRKLNRWNFRRVSSRRRVPPTYYHAFFQRGQEALCTQMYCNNDRSKFAISTKTDSDAEEEEEDESKTKALVHQSLQGHTSRSNQSTTFSASTFQEEIEGATDSHAGTLRLDQWPEIREQGRQSISGLNFSSQQFHQQGRQGIFDPDFSARLAQAGAQGFDFQIRAMRLGQHLGIQQGNQLTTQNMNNDNRLIETLVDLQTKRLLSNSVIGQRPSLQNDLLSEALAENQKSQLKLQERLLNNSVLQHTPQPNLMIRQDLPFTHTQRSNSNLRMQQRGDIIPTNQKQLTAQHLLVSPLPTMEPTTEGVEQQDVVNLVALQLAAIQQRHSNK